MHVLLVRAYARVHTKPVKELRAGFYPLNWQAIFAHCLPTSQLTGAEGYTTIVSTVFASGKPFSWAVGTEDHA